MEIGFSICLALQLTLSSYTFRIIIHKICHTRQAIHRRNRNTTFIYIYVHVCSEFWNYKKSTRQFVAFCFRFQCYRCCLETDHTIFIRSRRASHTYNIVFHKTNTYHDHCCGAFGSATGLLTINSSETLRVHSENHIRSIQSRLQIIWNKFRALHTNAHN